MTKQEFSKFAITLRTCYPKETILPNNDAMDTWYGLLQDIPYEIASTGLQKWAMTNKWSPSIAEIREFSVEVKQGQQIDWSEGWQEVQKAIRHFGMYRPDEAMESMNPLTQKVVRRLGFQNLCLSESQETDRANFRQIFQAEAEREKKDSQISPRVKELIGGIQTKLIEG